MTLVTWRAPLPRILRLMHPLHLSFPSALSPGFHMEAASTLRSFHIRSFHIRSPSPHPAALLPSAHPAGVEGNETGGGRSRDQSVPIHRCLSSRNALGKGEVPSAHPAARRVAANPHYPCAQRAPPMLLPRLLPPFFTPALADSLLPSHAAHVASLLRAASSAVP